MPNTPNKEGKALSADQARLLVGVILRSEAVLTPQQWDELAKEMDIITGRAAKERFRYLMNQLGATTPKRPKKGRFPARSVDKATSGGNGAKRTASQYEEDEGCDEETVKRPRSIRGADTLDAPLAAGTREKNKQASLGQMEEDASNCKGTIPFPNFEDYDCMGPATNDDPIFSDVYPTPSHSFEDYLPNSVFSLGGLHPDDWTDLVGDDQHGAPAVCADHRTTNTEQVGPGDVGVPGYVDPEYLMRTMDKNVGMEFLNDDY